MSKYLQKITSFVLVFSLLLVAVFMSYEVTRVEGAELKYSVASAFQNAVGVTADGYKYDFNSDSSGANLVTGKTSFKDKISTAVGNSESSMKVTSSKTARFEGFTQFYTNNRWSCESEISFDMKMASSSEDFSGFYIKYGEEMQSGYSKNMVFYSNDGVRGDSANSITGTTGIGFSFRTINYTPCIEVFVKYLNNSGKLSVSSQYFYDEVSNLYTFNRYKITDDNAGNVKIYVNDNLLVSFECSNPKVPTLNKTYSEKYYSTVKILDKNNNTLTTVSNALVSTQSALAFGTRNEILELDNIEILDTAENKLTIDSVFVSLSEDISLNFSVTKNKFDEAGYENPVLNVSFAGNDYQIKPMVTDVYGVSSYLFEFSNITPQMMNDVMSFSLSAELNGEITETPLREYSVATYLYSQLEDTTSPKFRRLLVDMLRYGSASQMFTNYNTTNLVDAKLTKAQSAWGTQTIRDFVDSSEVPVFDENVHEAKWIKMGLEIKELVSVTGSFSVESASGISVKIMDEQRNVIFILPTKQLSIKDNTDGSFNVSFKFSNVYSAQMSEVFLFEVCDSSGKNISGTYKYSIESCVKQSQKTVGNELYSFLNAMMIYGDSAYNYLTTEDEEEGILPENPGESNAPQDSNGVAIRQQYVQHLDEKYANYMEVPYGLDITKKTDLVSIFYSTWFNLILSNDSTPPNITEILEEGQRTGVYNWGAEGAFHYWAEPALGYYASDDKSVIRTHMTQLADAGVDFIIVDHTYMNYDRAVSDWEWDIFITQPCTALLDTIVEMRDEGLKTPYVVFWSGSFSETGWAVVERMYEEFYTVNKWKDCFVYWEGELFQLLTRTPSEPKTLDLTFREMWGLEQNLAAEHWSFLQHLNEPIQSSDGFTEQMCVCTAAQRDYMSNSANAQGREHGIFMYSQWYHAFQHRPKVISITWWNEWAAQRLPMSDGKTYHFTDNYNQEYSRDIEPMKGGHGDQYYLWMKEYIRAYRAIEECPVLVEEGYENQAKQTAVNKYGA